MKTPLPVYLDHNATTPLHPEVAEEMRPFLSEVFGNPSSIYSYGAQARTEVEKARSRVAGLLGCRNHEVIFTSGGSESNNMAIKGVALAYGEKGDHIITSVIEHPAVAEVCNALEKQGFGITRLEVDRYGLVSAADLLAAITPRTILVSIMHANNEIGTIQPVREIAAICREKGILFHTDAAQTAGKIAVGGLGADLITIAGHKLYGPKGVGALYIREGVKVAKLIHGADHEQNLRAGTENIMSIAGLGKACEVAGRDLEKNREHMQAMRDMLFEQLSRHLPGLRLNGHPEKRLPNTLNISFRGVEAGLLLPAIADRVAASAGAACHAAEVTLSPTLEAIHVPPEYAAGTVRFSTGRLTTREEVEFAVDAIVKALEKMLPNSTVSPFNHGKQGKIVDSGLSNVDFRRDTRSDISSTIDIRQPTTDNVYPLTHFTQGLGCACKLKPQLLQKVMAGLPYRPDKNVLIGPETFDDAAVYRISRDMAVVQTVDFFTPVVDDPYDFGRIAAANALSDIYAMGARPLFALNIAGFPGTRLPQEVLQKILLGASDKAAEAGISILGGHTTDDPEPKFGMAVTGTVHPDKVLKNSTAQPGDMLLLTKPIGTGILATALKRGLLDEETRKVMTETMAALNREAAEIMAGYPVSACTDITGFGLLGHLFEMTSASGVEAEVYASAVPLLPRVEELAAAGIVPGGSRANLDHVSPHIDWQDGISAIRRIILCDAQTSGGLLIAVAEEHAAKLAKDANAKVIGKITAGKGRLRVVSRLP
jgi:cysteine desulfurase NifS/selenium donor protein